MSEVNNQRKRVQPVGQNDETGNIFVANNNHLGTIGELQEKGNNTTVTSAQISTTRIKKELLWGKKKARKSINLFIDEDDKKKVEKLAKETNISNQEAYRRLIKLGLENFY
jgi:hypothetical protein